MSRNQSLAVIDATDAHVFTERQAEEIDKCQVRLSDLDHEITITHNKVIYLYVEAGWWLLRAKEVHRADTVSARSIGRFAEQEDAGFHRWFEAQQFSFTIRTARRWMEAARNVGLAVESNILRLRTIKEEKQLHGKTLGDLRKPYNKDAQQAQFHEVSDEERRTERLTKLKEDWRKWREFSTEQGINEQTWADGLSEEERAAICGIAYDLYQQVKKSLRKLKPTPKVEPEPSL